MLKHFKTLCVIMGVQALIYHLGLHTGSAFIDIPVLSLVWVTLEHFTAVVPTSAPEHACECECKKDVEFDASKY